MGSKTLDKGIGIGAEWNCSEKNGPRVAARGFLGMNPYAWVSVVTCKDFPPRVRFAPATATRNPAVGVFHLKFYKHHIGDFMRDTAHLSLLEEGIYRRLMDWYYINERPLPTDLERICRLVRATEDERAAVREVLNEFFALQQDGYHQSRCDRELKEWYERSEKAKQSAEARWNANAMRTHSECNAETMLPITHYPLPNRRHIGPTNRRHRLPADFEIDETGLQKAKSAGINTAAEFQAFKDFHNAKGSTMLDWQAAWRTWVTNAVKFSRGKTNDSRKRTIRELTGYDSDAIEAFPTRND